MRLLKPQIRQQRRIGEILRKEQRGLLVPKMKTEFVGPSTHWATIDYIGDGDKSFSKFTAFIVITIDSARQIFSGKNSLESESVFPKKPHIFSRFPMQDLDGVRRGRVNPK